MGVSLWLCDEMDFGLWARIERAALGRVRCMRQRL